MRFEDLLSRCDVEVFQNFLGLHCIRLLSLLDSKMSSPTFLRQLVLESIGATLLLLERKSRSQFIPFLRSDEALQLCRALGFGSVPDAYEFLESCSFSRGSKA